MISVSIVEDNPDFRNVITNFLKSRDEFVVKGVYSRGETALKGLVKDSPDIAIVDIKMPGISGIQLIKKVKNSLPQTQYLICTAHHDDENIFKALQAGASGYILKDADADNITDSIIDLYNGGAPMSPSIARKVISQLQTSGKQKEEYELTDREYQVLQHLSKGLLYKEIADKMDISAFTIKNHLKNIYRKLQVQNKVEAINKLKLF